MRRAEIDRKRAKSRDYVAPMGYEPREPDGRSPLADFIASCEGEISAEEATREYQKNWCKHPREKQRLITTIAMPFAERFEYEQGCDECGLLRTYKGRVPGWLTLRRR